MMTPAELILMHLAIRPMGFNELMRATGLRRTVMRQTLDALDGAGRAFFALGTNGGRDTWHLGAAPMNHDRVMRDYAIEREVVAPGHTVVRFGDRWRAGHGQRPPATPGLGNALGNIYA